MDQDLQTTNTSLTLTRVFKASPEELWQLWTDAKEINKWHRPNTVDYTTTSQADVTEGGDYKISMESSEGTHSAFGKFKILDPPHKLVYSWQWDNDPTQEISEVTVLFTPVSEGTKLTLVHDRLKGPESVRAHADGWVGCVENIMELIKQGER